MASQAGKATVSKKYKRVRYVQRRGWDGHLKKSVAATSPEVMQAFHPVATNLKSLALTVGPFWRRRDAAAAMDR